MPNLPGINHLMAIKAFEKKSVLELLTENYNHLSLIDDEQTIN